MKTQLFIGGMGRSGRMMASTFLRRALLFVVLADVSNRAVAGSHPLQAVPVASVTVEGGFWGARVNTNAAVTVPHNFEMLENSGRMANFDRAAGINPTPYTGNLGGDSDVFKVIEGAAYTLQLRPGGVDADALARQVRRVIAAQQEDGFLGTAFILTNQASRWDNLRFSHLLYNAGHLFEAGVAYREATGRTNLLAASARYADLIDQRFGPGKVYDVDGHQEVELALIKLYRATGQRRYLDLAKFFLDEHGHIHGGTNRIRAPKPRASDYNQDRVPLVEAEAAVGHAVRAGYVYSAMVDVAAQATDAGYRRALDRLWQDVVGRKLYLTGGSATAQYHDEGFGDPYHLPNESAYGETCGTIASALWCYRMALLHADATHADVLERALYNGVLSGISLSGDRFFYTNPLASRGRDRRQPAWNPACCQCNLVRVIPQVGALAYATRPDEIYVNLYVAGAANLNLANGSVRLRQETDYPLGGRIRITVETGRKNPFTIAVRIPGWAREEPVPSDLYQFDQPSRERPTLKVAGQTMGLAGNEDASGTKLDSGYVRLRRKWKAGDVIELNLPMPVRRVLARDAVAENRGRVALQRGPLVYCVEAVDHDGLRTDAIVLPDEATLRAERRQDFLGDVMVITGQAGVAVEPHWGEATVVRPQKLMAIPYYAWANRGTGFMEVWLARTATSATPLPATTAADDAVASASNGAKPPQLSALTDGRLGPRSDYRATPRFTMAASNLAPAWIQYDWPQPRKLTRAAVYWAVDRRAQVYWGPRIRGEDIALPKSWRLLYLDGADWRPVELQKDSAFTLRLDMPNEVTFKPVTTRAVRLEAESAGVPSGVQEWRIE